MLLEAGATGTVFLAHVAGSTIAGYLTILGVANNIIIIQNAEHRVQPSPSSDSRIWHPGENSSEPGLSCMVPYYHQN